MKCVGLIVLTHDPGADHADFLLWMTSKGCYVGIPTSDCGIALDDAIGELRQRMLDPAGMRLVVKIPLDLWIAQLAAKPRPMPSQEWHENREYRHDR